MAKISKYLQEASSRRASDIHFSAGGPVWARVDGDLTKLPFPELDAKELQDTLFEILSDTERQRFNAHKNVDKSFVFEGIGYFRVNIFMTRKGIAAVLRTIPQRIPSPAQLGLPASVVSLTETGKGLILVTGPTGSGKSTTLAALIGHINATYPYHILTAEDPVEFVHENNRSLINQREIGSSCLTFADALKYALREDPDVILVGEMRDLETISLALTAAETGHLVFGTLHTRGAGASVDRIIDSFPANQQAMIRTMLAESLVAVISQSLLKRADGGGRVAAYEIMTVNHAISNLIREGKTFQIGSIIQTAKKDGMVLMDQYILGLVNQGIVTAEEAAGYMEDSSLVMGPNSKVRVGPLSPVKIASAAAAPTPLSRPDIASVPPPAAPPAPAKVAAAAPAIPTSRPPVGATPAAQPVPSKPVAAAAPIPKAAPAIPRPPVPAPPAAVKQQELEEKRQSDAYLADDGLSQVVSLEALSSPENDSLSDEIAVSQPEIPLATSQPSPAAPALKPAPVAKAPTPAPATNAAVAPAPKKNPPPPPAKKSA